MCMTRARRVAGAAWRRVLVRESVRALGITMSVGAACGVLGATATRLVWAGDSRTSWIVLGAGVGAGLVAGLALGWARARRIGVTGAAIEVDRALGLRDRITSSLTFGSSEDEAFVALALEDAERAASGARAGRAVRVRMGRWWGVWPAVTVAGVLVGLWVPAMTLLDPRAKAERMRQVALQEERDRAVEDVRAALEQLRGEEESGAVTAEELRALEEIERELEKGVAAGEEGRAMAAAALEEMAREREELERRAQEQVDTIASRVASQGAQSENGDRAQELREALARGDMDAAAEALRALEEPGALTDEEMRELAREMEDLAEALESAQGEQGENESAGDGAKELSESLKEAANEVNEQSQGGGEASESGKKGESEKHSQGSTSPNSARQEGSASSGQQGEGEGKSPTQQPKGQAGQGSKAGEKASGDAVRRAQETMRKLGEQQQGATKQGQKAKDIRGVAQQLMEGDAEQAGQEEGQDGPGSRRQGDAGGGAGEGSNGLRMREPGEERPSNVQDVDARRGASEREGGARSFEWYNPNAREGRGTVDARVAAERLREAAKSAERAIEDQTLPSRYSKLLREYYRRMPDAVRGDAPASGGGESAPAEPKPSGG